MYLIAIAWMYVVVMMALAEAMSAQGTLLGAFFTLVLYGCMPLAIVMYLLGTPMRRRARRAAEAAEAAETAVALQTAMPAEADQRAAAGAASAGSGPEPDGRSHTPGDPIAAEGEKR